MRKIFLILFTFSLPLFGSSAYVFDFGGVLAEVDRQVIRTYLLDSLVLTEEQLNAVIPEWRAARSAGCSEEAFWTEFACSHGIVLPTDWFMWFEQAKVDSMLPKNDVIELVSELYCRGYRLVLFSNIREDEAAVVYSNGFHDYFHSVLLSNESTYEKPDPRAYLRLIKALQLPPEEIFFVDDGPENVEGALEMGIDAVLFTDADSLRAALHERGVLP